MKTTGISRQNFLWLALFILLLGTTLRMWELSHASLWVDEADTHLWMQGSLWDGLKNIASVTNHTPLYYFFMRLLPTEDEVSLRFSAVLSALLGIALLIRFTRTFYGSASMALLAGLLLATNPYHVWLSRWARPYGVMPFVSLLVMWVFLRLFLSERPSKWQWAGFTLVSMAAYQIHFFALFLPAIQFLMFPLMRRNNRHLFWGWIVAQAIAVIPFFLWLGMIAEYSTSFAVSWIQQPSLWDVGSLILNFIMGYEGELVWYIVPALAIGVVGLLRGFAPTPNKLVTLYLALSVVLPVAAVFLISQRRPLFVDRYFMFSLPPTLLLMLGGWYRLRPYWKNIAWVAGLLISITGVVVVGIGLANDSYTRTDWRGSVAYLEANRNPDDTIVVFQFILPFNFYYQGSPEHVLDANDFAEPLADDIPDNELRIESGEQVWVIYRDTYIPDESQNGEPLTAESLGLEETHPIAVWLADYTLAHVERFKGVTVLQVTP